MSEALKVFGGHGSKAFEPQRLEKLAKDKQTTTEHFSFETFAKKHDFKARFSSEILSQPLLTTKDQVSRKVSAVVA